MARKGIEEMISEIEIFIDNCKFQPLSSSKIIVPREDLMQMVSELKLKIPNEIERCKKIMRNKEAILADARARADSIITESVAEANEEADQVRTGAMYYSKDKLAEISQYIDATLQAERANYENLIKSLEDNSTRVASNMAELDSSINQMNGVIEQSAQVDSAFDTKEDEYNVYGKTEYTSKEDEYDDEYDEYDDDDYDDEDDDDEYLDE